MFLRTISVALFVVSFFASFVEAGPVRLETVFLHELMHAVNVDHPQSGVPSVVSKDTTYYTTLQPADVGALWSLYGQKPGTEYLASNSLYRLGSGTPWPTDPDGITRVSYALDPELEILSPYFRPAWLSATGAISDVSNILFHELPHASEPLAVDIFVRPLLIDGPGNMLGYAYFSTGDFVKRYTDERYGDIYIDFTDSFYVASVPEPSTLVLGLGASLFTLVFYKRRTMRRIRG